MLPQSSRLNSDQSPHLSLKTSISADADLNTATIVLADDDQALLDGFADLIELSNAQHQITVLKAHDGQHALEIITQAAQPPDLIVSDVEMPRMDGYDLLQAVRDNPDWVHIPVILLTGQNSATDVFRGRTSGAELYLTKPFDPNALLEAVNAQLDLAQKRRSQRQQSAEAVRRHLLRTLQHEFRTPLNFVTAYYEILIDSLSSDDAPEMLTEYLEGIQGGTARLTKLLRDLILVIDLYSGELAQAVRSRARPISDIASLINELCLAYAETAQKSDLTLHSDLVEPLPMIQGDRATLFDLFSRLVDNAIKFTPAENTPAEIVISAETDANNLRITVSDHGIGIPIAAQPHLFELFYQYDRPMLEQQGSGAGLTIAKGLVDLHGGTIEVASKNGKGSAFTVSLPIYNPQKIMAWPVPIEQVQPNIDLLIVDDEPALLSGLAELLGLMAEKSQFQYRIHTAASGKDGLRILKSHAIDLVLCDIVMHGMDGYEFLERVHANPNWINIPVIFLTGRGDKRDVQHGRRLGVDEYIIKPYNPDELFGVVEARLQRYRAVQNVYNATFQELRQSVLELLGPHFINPLDTVADHSQVLLDQVSSAETITDLKGSLIAIERGSRLLVDLVDDFTMLVELRTGAAQSAYVLRAEPIRFLGDLIQGACEGALLSAESTPPKLTVNLSENLPEIIGDTRFLTYALQRLTGVLANYCINAANNQITVTAYKAAETVTIKLSCAHHVLKEMDVAQIRALMDNGKDELIANPALGSAFIIITELIALHNGQTSITTTSNGGMSIIIDLPASQTQH